MKKIFFAVGIILAMILPISANSTVSITSQPISAYGNVGDRLDFYITAYGEEIKYAWYWRLEDILTGELLEESEIGTDYTASLILTSQMADPTKKSYVYCLVSDSSGKILISQSAEATVHRSKPFDIELTYQPGSEIICSVGDEVIISAVVMMPESELGTLAYQWYRSGPEPIRIEGETKPYLVVPTDIAGVLGYYCTVTNEKNGNVNTSDLSSGVRVIVKAATNLSFDDVAPSEWYYDSVRTACIDGLLKGKSPANFCPSDGMTVAEAVTIACRLNQLSRIGEINLANGSDVWYSTYMRYAIENGIIGSDLSASANDPITRGQFAEIFANALPDYCFGEVKNVKNGSVPDVELGHRYEASIYKLYRSGILNGYEDGLFHPDDLITRAEAAVVAVRMEGLYS